MSELTSTGRGGSRYRRPRLSSELSLTTETMRVSDRGVIAAPGARVAGGAGVGFGVSDGGPSAADRIMHDTEVVLDATPSVEDDTELLSEPHSS